MDELEQLRAENKHLKQEIAGLNSRLVAAEDKIKALVALLGQNSRNSNWPASRDKDRHKSPPKNDTAAGTGKAGGQKGHPGATLEPDPNPKVVIEHRPTVCGHCQSPLGSDGVVCGVVKRQVWDLPPLDLLTTEHQAETVLCPDCGQATTAPFPVEVTQPVQYGEQVKRLAVYLHTEQFIPYQRSRQLLADLFGLSISTGTLQNFVATAAEAVQPVVAAIKDTLIQAPVAHADETGFYIQGERSWLHTVSSPHLTYLAPHQRRGQAATKDIGLLPHFSGILVHDAWASYFKYKSCQHALCHAHHLRELTAIMENTPQIWAELMLDFLRTLHRQVKASRQTGATAFPPDQLARLQQWYEALIALGLTENPLPQPQPPPNPRGRPKKTKGRNLVERFQTHAQAILRFAYDFKVPFDNNLAERDIRMMKVQQKISGCFRSWTGAQQFCQLRSYFSTLRKQGLNIWQALGSLFQGQVLYPKLTPV